MTAVKDIDVTALGELLIDFTQNGRTAQGNITFEANPGGAPCNVLSMLNNLGRKVSFIGKVGDDAFGDLLREAVQKQGIDVGGLCSDAKIPTTLAFVHTLPDGDRDFSFYRKPGADACLTADEVDYDRIRRAQIFHFGSLSLTNEPVREATQRAVQTAEESGCLCSFDPNLRPSLWNSLDEAKAQIRWGLGHCDILKISDNEIRWFTCIEDFDEGASWLLSEFPRIRLLCLSRGRDGSTAYTRDLQVSEPAFIREDTIETTGAGDTFGACVLNDVLEYGPDGLTADRLRKMLVFANAAASVITTRKGALRVMPTRTEINALAAERLADFV